MYRVQELKDNEFNDGTDRHRSKTVGVGAMKENKYQRKLSAILYADVEGYSRLTGEDEEGTASDRDSSATAATAPGVA